MAAEAEEVVCPCRFVGKECRIYVYPHKLQSDMDSFWVSVSVCKDTRGSCYYFFGIFWDFPTSLNKQVVQNTLLMRVLQATSKCCKWKIYPVGTPPPRQISDHVQAQYYRTLPT